MERVVVCPVCKDTDSCFEEMQENFSSYMCFNCGYMSDSRYRVGSVELVDNMNASPQLVQDLQYVDETKGIVWFPCVIMIRDLMWITQKFMVSLNFSTHVKIWV